MKKTRAILAILLSGYLVLAMGGLNIFHHICNCNTALDTKISILADQSCCTANSYNNLPSHAGSEHRDCSQGNCSDCNCETQATLLAVDYTTINSEISTELSKLFQFATSSINPVEILTESEIAVPVHNIKVVKSPPKAGKHLVILNQSLKIPLSVS